MKKVQEAVKLSWKATGIQDMAQAGERKGKETCWDQVIAQAGKVC